MSRLVSFVVLVGILILVSWLFIEVMAQFLLPLFFAVLLVVLFRPVHAWFLGRCRSRARLAAGLTTAAVALIVLVPVLGVLSQAAIEGVAVARGVDQESLREAIEQRGARLLADVRAWAGQFGVHVPRDQELVDSAAAALQTWIAPAALRTTQALLDLLVGLAIMLVALYFFLLDGPAMIETAMRLSPLDDRYERQLVAEFGQVSRAVVLATLLSALAQGVLGTIGYLIAGLGTVFLLSVLTALFALVPFVGAAVVWVPCAAWLYFYEGRTGAAIFLAAWGLLVVSMADNLIKPWVLKGQSNLHPLLAFLSVLGGASALGPIGILIGPLVVAFLQALLNILQHELAVMARREA